MIGLYASSALMGILVIWAIIRVRLEYTSNKILTGTSVVFVWSAYVVHAGKLIFAAVLQVWPLTNRSGIASLVGIVLTITGLTISTAAILDFRSIQRMSGLIADKLFTSGVYAWSRNPQNFGWGLALLGITVMSSSSYAFLLLIFFALSIHVYIVLLEEPYLEDLYGEAY